MSAIKFLENINIDPMQPIFKNGENNGNDKFSVQSIEVLPLQYACEQFANEAVKNYIRFIFKEQELVDSEVDVMFKQFNEK